MFKPLLRFWVEEYALWSLYTLVYTFVNPYLWVPNLEKTCWFERAWRQCPPRVLIPVQMNDSLLLTLCFPPFSQNAAQLPYLKSFLACLLNLHSAHSALRTLNLGMILHHVLWFQDWLVSRRVLKPQQADWKLSKQAEEEKRKKSKSPATQAWKALYTYS